PGADVRGSQPRAARPGASPASRRPAGSEAAAGGLQVPSALSDGAGHLPYRGAGHEGVAAAAERRLSFRTGRHRAVGHHSRRRVLVSAAVRIGVIGLGFMGSKWARTLREHDGVELAVVCDVREDRARAVAEQLDARWSTDPAETAGDTTVDGLAI